MTHKKLCRIRLNPVGAELNAPAGTALRDLLFEQGVEFPCGGQGRCRGCRVRLLEGGIPPNDAQRDRLSAREIGDGWRLACQARVESDLVIEMRQWDAAILDHDSAFAFTPRDGWGLAVDLGTTTLVAQLIDRETGHTLAVKTALNPQARWGADVMSRVERAMTAGGAAELTASIRAEIGRLVGVLLKKALVTDVGHAGRLEARPLRRAVVVGNTVMHHLFCGVDIEPLTRYPFEPVDDGLKALSPEDLGWNLSGHPELPLDLLDGLQVEFLPCLGGFVGSDILAGLLATGMPDQTDLSLLMDLGTNGEVALGNRDRILCASTAAGPAFEGARISCGMRAATGAIYRVTAENGDLHADTLGNAPAAGICGSGLVDAAAAALDLGLILPTGRILHYGPLAKGEEAAIPLADGIVLTQTDVRQLQLAKGAIAAGTRILLSQWGADVEDVETVYLAGAFGNYVDRASARRIGLLPFPLERIQPSGNTALLGAKLALFAPEDADRHFTALRKRVTHVSLHADPQFQETYVTEMSFPPARLAALV